MVVDGLCFVVGVDEVGRGCLVGLVVVVVVVVEFGFWLFGVDDLKKFKCVYCECFVDEIEWCVVVVYWVVIEVDVID